MKRIDVCSRAVVLLLWIVPVAWPPVAAAPVGRELEERPHWPDAFGGWDDTSATVEQALTGSDGGARGR
jgi:hypothetical protein